MGSEHCWECEEEYLRNEVLDIPIFKTGWTVKWCFNCVMKQLDWSDYRLIHKPEKYIKFKIQSFEDRNKLYGFYIDELIKCYELQIGEISHDDWSILTDISIKIVWEDED